MIRQFWFNVKFNAGLFYCLLSYTDFYGFVIQLTNLLQGGLPSYEATIQLNSE